MKNIVFIAYFALILSLSLMPVTGNGQETERLSLDKCVEIALKNNLDLQSSKLSRDEATIHFEESRSDLWPDLNGSFSSGFNNGRSIDPYSNSYIDQGLSFSNAGLVLNAIVFQGFHLANQLKRDRFAMKAAEAETEASRQALVLKVTLAYLQVLNNQDLVALAKSRTDATQKQVDRLKNRYDEGKGNPADYTDIKGQLAQDSTDLITSKKNLKAARFNLEHLLNVDYTISPKALLLPENFKKYPFSSEEIFREALVNLATFQSKTWRIKAADKDIRASRALYSPKVSFFAQLSSNYSSLARSYTQIGTEQVENGGQVTINDQVYPVYTTEPRFAEHKTPYFDQLNNNLNTVVGVEVTIPIFNGFRAKHKTRLKKVKLEEAKVDFEDTKSKFKQSIKEAHADMEAAYQQIGILEDQLSAYHESYRINEIRFSNGVSNIVEYIISKNNLENARINLKNAQYDFLLREKILEYYRKG